MQAKLRDEKIVERKTYSELVLEQLKDLRAELREQKREINDRLDRMDRRIDRIEFQLDSLEKKFDYKLDKFDEKISNSTKHNQILTGTIISIVLVVLFTILK